MRPWLFIEQPRLQNRTDALRGWGCLPVDSPLAPGNSLGRVAVGYRLFQSYPSRLNELVPAATGPGRGGWRGAVRQPDAPALRHGRLDRSGRTPGVAFPCSGAQAGSVTRAPVAGRRADGRGPSPNPPGCQGSGRAHFVSYFAAGVHVSDG